MKRKKRKITASQKEKQGMAETNEEEEKDVFDVQSR